MPCHPLMCRQAADCADIACPGHPHGVAAYLDEQDRRAAIHHAAMSRPLSVTLEGPEPIEPAPPAKLTGADWVAIAFCIFVYAIAFARITGVI